MRDEDKIRLANMALEFISDTTEKPLVPKHIGYLKQEAGPTPGFKKLPAGTPVFEFNNRYLLFLESLDGKTSVETSYYKKKDDPYPNLGDSLEDIIEFI